MEFNLDSKPKQRTRVSKVPEALNLYKLHSNPEEVSGLKALAVKPPEIVWDAYEDDPDEIKKHKHIWANDPYSAYRYITDYNEMLPFPEGEDTIAKSPYHAYWYAYNVLHGRFPKGELVILADDSFGPIYKMDIKWNLI